MQNKDITNWDKVPVLFDTSMACRLFGVTRQTIDKWTKTKGMPVIKIDGTYPRFEKTAVIEWLNQQTISARNNREEG